MLTVINNALDDLDTSSRDDPYMVYTQDLVTNILVYMMTTDKHTFDVIMTKLKEAPVYDKEAHAWIRHSYSIVNTVTDGVPHTISHEELCLIDVPQMDRDSMDHMIHDLEEAGYHLNSVTLVSSDVTPSSD